MAKVTAQDILKINKIYYECRNKAQTARETGFSASTVAKYINPNYSPNSLTVKEIVIQTPNLELFKQSNWNSLLLLSDFEKEEIEELRKEVLI